MKRIHTRGLYSSSVSRMKLHSLSRFLTRAYRRALFSTTTRRVSRYLSYGIGCSVILLVAARFWGSEPSWAVLAAPLGLSLFLGVLVAIVQTPRSMELAKILDERLQFRDRLATVVEIDSDPDLARHPMADIVRQDTQRLAAGFDPAAAFPLSLTFRDLAPVLLAAIALALAHFLIPPLNLGDRLMGKDPRTLATPQQIEIATQSIARSADAIRSLLDEPADPVSAHPDGASMASQGEAAKSTRETLEVLDRLVKQLNPQSRESPDPTLTEAADQLESLADSLNAEAQRSEDVAAETARQLADLAPPEPEESELRPSGALSGTIKQFNDFKRALGEGDFSRADQVLQDMAARQDTLTPSEREALANRLLELSRQLAQARQETDSTVADPMLPDAGRDESTLDAEVESDSRPKTSNSDLESGDVGQERDPGKQDMSGRPPQNSPERFDELTREKLDEHLRREADGKLEELARNLEQLSREIQEPANTSTPSPADSPDRSRPGRDQSVQPQSQQSESPSSQGEAGQPDQESASDPGRSPQKSTDQLPSADPQQSEAPGSDQSAPAPQPSQNKEDLQQTSPMPESSDPAQEEMPPDAKRSVEPPLRQSTSDPSQPGRPGVSPPEPSPQPGPDATPSAQRISEILRELTQAPQQAQRSRQISQAAREQAQQLLEQMSSEQREQLQRWADANQSSGQNPQSERADALTSRSSRVSDSSPTAVPGYERVENIDATDGNRPVNDDQVLAEWLTDPTDADRRIDPASAPFAFVDRLRAASQALEHASEDQALSPRYRELLRKWAHRLPAVPEQPAPEPSQDDESGD